MNKKIYLLIVLAAFAGFASCKGKTDGAKADSNGPATADEIAQQVSQAICKKLVECSPGQNFDQQKCSTETQTSITDLLVQKIITLTKTELSGCVGAITTGKCEEVLNAQGPPKGCEKLQ